MVWVPNVRVVNFKCLGVDGNVGAIVIRIVLWSGDVRMFVYLFCSDETQVCS